MKYIALTIGPIIKTLSGAKKTQELWASSYLFSYLMKEIIRVFEDREFVVPYVDKKIMSETTQVGLFHDRFIFCSQAGDIERLELAIRDTIIQLAKELGIDGAYLRQYLQIHYGEYESTDFGSENEHNPILGTTPYMDATELMYHPSIDGDDQLRKALKKKDNFFKTKIFGKKGRSFPSLPEIALADMMDEGLRQRILGSEDELDIYDIQDVNPYHKYIAIVHADGDNMGKVVSSLQAGEFSHFSKKLFEYCSESEELISAYGGATIFAGGDDLLFFAPVANQTKKQNIFGLIESISELFDAKFAMYNSKLTAKNIEATTLSFGVSMTYYKFPLYEALEQSRNLLFDKAKGTSDKNAIAYTVIKHSGQTFGGIIGKRDTDTYGLFLDVVNSMSEKENSGNFLHSLHHKIDTYQVLIREACRCDDDSRLTNFFNNFFKKEDHKTYDILFAAMTKYIYAVYQQDLEDKEKLQTVYGVLRFIKFLQGDKS